MRNAGGKSNAQPGEVEGEENRRSEHCFVDANGHKEICVRFTTGISFSLETGCVGKMGKFLGQRGLMSSHACT